MTTLTEIKSSITSGTAMIQSPYLYLQAAGSNGTDGSADGIHLRWDFLRSLGNHFPKGNLASGTGAPYTAAYGFNKANDFVDIMRVPYYFRYPCTVNFNTDLPNSLVETGITRLWRFDTVVQSSPKGEHCEVLIIFDDITQYDAIRATINPMISPYQFLSQYTGVVEASVTGKLSFALTCTTLATGKSPILRMESISSPENIADADLFVSCRKVFGPNTTQSIRNPELDKPIRPIVDNTIELIPIEEKKENKIIAENIVKFRFDFKQCVPVELRLETYEQFILGSTNQKQTIGKWKTIGEEFFLSEKDSIVYNRLENLTSLNVNHKWPRYFGGNQTSGLFTANVQNYKAKWDPKLAPLNEVNDLNGLRRGVINYLKLSQQSTNPLAIAALPNSDTNDQSSFNISYFQMLKIIGLDYHVARMLGMGYIDPTPLAQGNDIGYIYLSIYHTVASLEPGDIPSPHMHFYMTLPTTRMDFRLPPAPVQDNPTFGITIDNGTGFPEQLTDVNGYAPFDDLRIINLNIKLFDTYQPLNPFFIPPTEFLSGNITKAVFYGIKYKLAGELNYRVPELSHDSEFSDSSGVFETTPIVPQLAEDHNAALLPLYSHEERENGNHEYRIYGINWFSRNSALSNMKSVNTLIPTRNTLIPPSNFAVQLIQTEDPLILTTSFEQAALHALTGDQTLVRLTFDWNQNHYIPQKFSPSNKYANVAQFFFRQEPPRAVQGEIKSITQVPNTQFLDIRTKPYNITSSSSPQTINPNVIPGDEPRFAGSYFASNQILYIVDTVLQSSVSGEGAIFRIKKVVQKTANDLSNNNQFSATMEEILPVVGDRFFVTENMNNTANWGTTFIPNTDVPLTKQIDLVTFLNGGHLHTETEINHDGTQTTLNIGGIYETAKIKELLDVDEHGIEIPNSRTGIYEIEFDTFQLAAHPDSDVEWYKGSVRIIEDSNFLPTEADPSRTIPRMKVLDVWKIETSIHNTLKLTVYDSTLDVKITNYIPQNSYCPVVTSGLSGVSKSVNFHPGYRVYLKAQSTVFDKSTIYPGSTHSSKQTFMSSRSVNTTTGMKSFLNSPVVLQSRKISPPIAPGLPIGPLYATRPNFYGKSTWTMDIPVTVDANREPHALVFYRANERAVLDTLYKKETVDDIVNALKILTPEDQVFEANRWLDLINVTNLNVDNEFNEYTSGGYRFPNPDNNNYVIPSSVIKPFVGTAPGNSTTFTLPNGLIITMTEAVRQAIEGIFLPLTESPLIFKFIKTGKQTSSRKPVTRNTNGDLLVFDEPAFDPSPMAVKYTDGGNTFVRFSDFTLDGTLLNMYFYYAVEMNDEMKFSTKSLVAGPIKLVNSYPAEQPGIRKVTAILEDPIAGILPAINLELNPYLESENIRQIKLYRANNATDATSVRMMELVDTYEITDTNVIQITDSFPNLIYPLFGDPLFYRAVALREIINEFDQQEYIPSRASELGMAMIADVINPASPNIIPTIGTITATELMDVNLSWNITAYNAHYYLYKLNNFGNWVRIFDIKTKDNSSCTYTLPENLLKKNDDGDTLYHHFKVQVENASGLFNLEDKQLTL